MSERKSNEPKLDYERVFAAYDLDWRFEKNKDKVSKYMKRKLEKRYPGKSWDSLSEVEKEIFIYIDMKQEMLDKYVPARRNKKLIEEKINAHISEVMLNTSNGIYLEKDVRSRYFYDKSALDAITDTDKRKKAEKKAYNQFVDALKVLSPFTPVPTLEDWVADNQKAPKTINDYELYHILHPNTEETKPVKPVVKASQSDIDHVLLLTIVKVLKEQKIADIDVDKIEKCLTVLKTFHEFPIHPLMLEYDPKLETGEGGNLKMTKEEQEQYIKECKDYLYYQEMCDNLSFYEVLGEK